MADACLRQPKPIMILTLREIALGGATICHIESDGCGDYDCLSSWLNIFLGVLSP